MIDNKQIKKILDFKKEWIDQIEYCNKGIGRTQEVEDLKKKGVQFFGSIIPIDNLILKRELKKLELERFTLWSGQNGYLLKCNKKTLKRWLDFIEKVVNVIEIYPIKVYLDSSILTTPLKIDDRNAEALKKLSENPRVIFYTSEKVKREIENYKNLKGRAYLLFIYNLLKKISEENIIKSVPALFDSIMFDEATFNGSADREDFLFTKLKQIFDKDDAEHIFQAEKHNLDYFLTLDKKTILTRVKKRQAELKKNNLKIFFVSPEELLQDLELNLKKSEDDFENENLKK